MGELEKEAVESETVFIGCGCNRVVNAAAWGPCNLVAFGAHNAVAIFCPQVAKIICTLPGHKDLVNCVEWLPKFQIPLEDGISIQKQYLLSGSADGAIILWAYTQYNGKWETLLQLPSSHDKAVTCIASAMLSSHEAVVVSSSSDCTVHLWNILFPVGTEGECKVTFLQSIPTGPRVIVAVSLATLPDSKDRILLAMGGLDNNIRIYSGTACGEFVPACILKGHHDWIRSLDFSHEVPDGDKGAIYLASSGQDRNIRIWKIERKSNDTEAAGYNDSKEQGHSIKMYIEGPVFRAGEVIWQASMESLLIGHDDWVYSVKWQPPLTSKKQGRRTRKMSILSASMDRTMMIWRPDVTTGLWMNEVTVGELGHTALGFYGGSWSPFGDAILAHAFGGSFHLWKNVGGELSDWQPQLVPSGHSSFVSDIAWAKNGQFLITTSHDQTTRLFAPWNWDNIENEKGKHSWHEIARPQVHGHDLNCLAVTKGGGNHQIISGAEEKVARVFEAPTAFLKTLEHVEGYDYTSSKSLENVKVLGANMSALGLSQKPIYSSEGQSTKSVASDMDNIETVPDATPAVLIRPPLEEHLGWNTLWPETHKLYGHGNELFSMCSDHCGQLLATASKAQTTNAADIWLWEVGSWKAVAQLHSHTLTVTQMEFSHNDKFLLSVSRDRHFSLFKAVKSAKDQSEFVFELYCNVEAHKRIIWTCSWSPCDQYFGTGSRDKTAKIWAVKEVDGNCVTEQIEVLAMKSSVTAMAWAPTVLSKDYLLGLGLEDGRLELWKVKSPAGMKSCPMFQFDIFSCHVASVNRMVFNEKPRSKDDEDQDSSLQLATCGADHTVRVFKLKLLKSQR